VRNNNISIAIKQENGTFNLVDIDSATKAKLYKKAVE
jgi:hypothetical protein